MSELAEIAESVAIALGLNRSDKCWWEMDESLRFDGLNLYEPYWQVRCQQWLLEQGSLHYYKVRPYHCFVPVDGNYRDEIKLECPSHEFAARAIHERANP